MNQQHLMKYSRLYNYLRKYVATAHTFYYNDICVINAENIPDKEPVLFAANHQNGLMDALAIGLTIQKQPVFMARADIFKNSTVRRILNFFKIIPVYRIQDGADNMNKNKQYFDIALRILGYGLPVVIMPEGTHGEHRRLKPLKKGIARFALSAQETLGDAARVKIVPVGINYDHYSNFRGNLQVIYGKPIEITDYLLVYQDNPIKAYNLLRNRLAGELKKLMINIDSQEYYDEILCLKEIYTNNKLQINEESDITIYDRFKVEKSITDKLDNIATTDAAKLNSLQPLVHEYINTSKRLGLEDWVFQARVPDNKALWFDIAKYLLFLPFFATSAMVNGIPAYICKYFSDKTEDTQFRSSFKFAIGAFLFPLFYLIFLALPVPIYTKLILIIPMPVLGVLSFDYYKSIRKQWLKFKYFKMLKAGNYELNNLIQVREKILRVLNELL